MTRSRAKKPAAPIVAGLRGRISSNYSINVREEPGCFQLFNYEEPCGDRLVKHNSEKLRFPLKPTSIKVKPWQCRWSRFSTFSEADKAAKALQKYLDACDRKKEK